VRALPSCEDLQRIFEAEVVGSKFLEPGLVETFERLLNPIANKFVVVVENQGTVAESLNVELDELARKGIRCLERFPGVLQIDILSDAAAMRAD